MEKKSNQETSQVTKSILIPLAEDCEELEAVTLIDLFRRAGINVTTASLNDDTTVRCSRGVCLVADTNLQAVMDDNFDMIVLPGGLPGADHLNNDPRIHQLLTKHYKNGDYVAAICAAPRVLISNDDISVKHLTAYPGAVDHLDTSAFELETASVVRDNNVITSRGPGTAMDFALELIEILQGKQVRCDVEQALCRTYSSRV